MQSKQVYAYCKTISQNLWQHSLSFDPELICWRLLDRSEVGGRIGPVRGRTDEVEVENGR